MRVVGTNQLTMSFEPTVRQRFPTLRQCIHYTVLQDSRGIKAVASDLDMSESELSRRLAKPKAEKRHPRSCDVDLAVAIIHSTKNLLPIQWLLAEFCQDDQSRLSAAINTIETLAPSLLEAVAVIKRGKTKQ